MDCLSTEIVAYKQADEMADHRISELARLVKNQAKEITAIKGKLSGDNPLPAVSSTPSAGIGFWQWVVRISAPAALVIAVVAWVQPQWSTHSAKDLETTIDGRIDTKLKSPTKTLEDLRVDVARISTRLDDFFLLVKPAARRTLKDAAALPAKAFAAELPELKAAIDVAKTTKIPSADYASGLRERLRAISTDAPSYWQTVASFVSYRASDGSTVSQFLPPCELVDVFVEPGKTKIKDGKTGKVTTPPLLGPMLHADCTVGLDGRKIIGHRFVNSVVIYRGGKLDLENVSFQNCLWDIQIPQQTTPEKDARDILTRLLELDPKNLVLSTKPG
ncbi:MAG: hypothetical protein JWO19_5316 [Bryobacterales bacterium]|jgi:hypothetical protein|nr:hypothetical protein [Bryobacterales bacterium]